MMSPLLLGSRNSALAIEVCRDLGELESGEGRVIKCLSCGQGSVMSADYSWTCRRCGEKEGHVGATNGLLDAWNEAGNRAQWRAK